MNMIDHPLYVAALAGERIRIAVPQRTAFCVDRGKIVSRVNTCPANDLVTCDRFGTVVAHNRQCQDCGSYCADA